MEEDSPSLSSQQGDLIQSAQPVVREEPINTEFSAADTSTPLQASVLAVMLVDMTRWRLLNSVFLISAGTAKAVAAYENASESANTWDWVIGIVWALISYWVSILEDECPYAIPWLFEKPTRVEVFLIVFVPCWYLFNILYAHVLFFVLKISIERFGSMAGFVIVVAIVIGTVLLKAMESAARRLVIWYHFEPINISKLVIGLGFHCDDWNILDNRPGIWFLATFSCVNVVIVFYLVFSKPEMPSIITPSSLGFDLCLGSTLTLFIMYPILGFGRMAMRLARKTGTRQRAWREREWMA